ncbi:MAG: M48 family metalloprotease [Prochloraceae cyanobacterium]
MKRNRKRLPVKLIGGLLSFTLVLAFAPSKPVKSKLSPIQVTTTPSNSKDRLEIAQIFGPFRYQKLAEADQLYQQGEQEKARRIQKEVKGNFEPASPPPEPIYDPQMLKKLEPGAAVYWRIANEGIEQGLESKIFKPLKLLTENYPNFIPGHLLLAEQLVKYDRTSEAIEVLERVTSFFPDNTELLDRKIALLTQENELLLRASIAARQFVLSYPDRPEVAEYQSRAEEYEQQYQTYLYKKLSGLGFTGRIIAQIAGDPSGASIIGLLVQGESKTGEVLAQQYKAQISLVEDAKLADYVNEIGQKLAKFIGRDEFKYEFYVVQDGTANAFALPGGKIFINSGILGLIGSEAELAALLAHAIAHSALSHSFEKIADKANSKGALTIIPYETIIDNIATEENSQDKERQADIVATRLLNAAGYPADGLHSVMIIFKKLSGGRGSWLSSHPASDERVRYLEELIQRNGYNRYAYEGVKSYQIALGLVPDTETVAGSDSDLTTPNAQATIGSVRFSLEQTKDQVEVRIEGADVRADGSFTLKLAIANNSDRDVKINRSRVKVFDASGTEVFSQFFYDENTTEDTIPPENTRKGKLAVSGVPWKNDETQNLTLQLRETLGKTRTFRLYF